jgi:hypothetical protein
VNQLRVAPVLHFNNGWRVLLTTLNGFLVDTATVPGFSFVQVSVATGPKNLSDGILIPWSRVTLGLHGTVQYTN